MVGGNDTGAPGSIGTFSASSALGRSGKPVVTETDINEDYHGQFFIQAIDHTMRKYNATKIDVEAEIKKQVPVMIFSLIFPNSGMTKTVHGARRKTGKESAWPFWNVVREMISLAWTYTCSVTLI